MKKLPLIKTIMSPFPHSIGSDMPLSDASAMMEENGVHHLPVTEGGELVGLVSSRDLSVGSSMFVPAGAATDLMVKDVCSTRAYIVDIHDSLEAVLRVMSDRHIGSAIVTKNDKLAGILTHADVCRSYADLLVKLRPNVGGDDVA